MKKHKIILPRNFLSPTDVGKDVGATSVQMDEVDKILNRLATAENSAKRTWNVYSKDPKKAAQEKLAASSKGILEAGHRKVAEKNRATRRNRGR